MSSSRSQKTGSGVLLSDWLFGPKLSAGQLARENKRRIIGQRAKIEVQIAQLRTFEQEALATVEQCTRQGRRAAAKTAAEKVQRLRVQIASAERMRTSLVDIELRIETLTSTEAMGSAMRNAAELMASANSAVSVPKMQRDMAEFRRQSAAIAEKQSLMDAALADTEQQQEAGAERDETADDILDQIESKVALESIDELSNAAPSTIQGWPEVPRSTFTVQEIALPNVPNELPQ
jgi:Snf7